MSRNEVLQFATRETLAKTVVGFAVAGLFLALVAVGLGVEDVVSVLADARLRWLAIACLSTLVSLAFWGKSWQVVLAVVGIDVPYRRLVVTYFAATFANYVTPLGQAGGEPFIAYVLARDTDASYEDSLASVVTADLLNLLPFFSFAAVGLSLLLWRTDLPTLVKPLAVGLLGLALGVPALAVGGWVFRERLRHAVLRVAAPLARRTDRVSLAGVRRRIDDLYEAFGRIATDRGALAETVVFAYVGWLFFALPLYFAGLTLGIHIDLLLVFFIVPASTLAGLVPSPGGTGAVEAALILLLVALVPVISGPGAFKFAFAVALVYRLASYWFALGVGGLAAVAVVERS